MSRKNGHANAVDLDIETLSRYLWEAANILRGPVDAADFKTYIFIFPLLFFKRLSDVYEEEYVAALEEFDGDVEFAEFPENYRFQVPEGCHWYDVRAKSANIGHALQKAMRCIEQANPDTLHGIFGDAQWTNKDRLSDALLKDLIEHFSSLNLGNEHCKVDILGQAYEYLIKKFADLTNKKAGEFYTPRSVAFFPGVDRAVGGYEGLIVAQDRVPDNATRDKFATEYSVLSRLWEALSPDPCLGPYEKDYKWLTQVYESVKPPSGNGKLLWHALGERLEKLRERHEQGLLHSLDFLKELLTLAKEVVQAEKQVEPVDEQAKAKAALTELFAEVKNGKTPMMVERIVTDIDEIVRLVRFPGWQNTKAGEREVQKALRKVIYVKYQVKDQDLFDKAFGYIRQYY